MTHSERIKKYFEALSKKTSSAYDVAKAARLKGYDPEARVDIMRAKNMAERVEGLISAVAPQIVGSGVITRIEELEKKYGRLSWEVALIIANEIADEKFCNFENKKEAMEVGIRTGFCYHTVGIVSAPLEGFVEIKIKQRKDGKEYVAMKYAGPIRGAGGTAAAVSLIIADYVRTKQGYSAYDPTEQEINRAYAELEDYHERIVRLQYHPSEEEIKFLIKHLPVEIDGDPTEKLEVSNYKDIPRVETNKIRGGFCLVLSMVALKAPKLAVQLGKWGKDLGLDWDFIDEFLKIQKRNKAKSSKKNTNSEKPKLTPDYTYITDLVAGRPILTHPLRKGGFRLRYGRSRASGYSAVAIHPATAELLFGFIATGTQLKTERPGKSASITFCDKIEGPIVKCYDGSVVRFETESEAARLKDQVEEIIFLGDMLISYGDFYDRNHNLIPAGYCEEWWLLELEKAVVGLFGSIDFEKLGELLKIDAARVEEIFKNVALDVSFDEAKKISKNLNIPLHPKYIFHWAELSKQKLLCLLSWISESQQTTDNIALPMSETKRFLELIGCPHKISVEYVIIEYPWSESLKMQLGILEKSLVEIIKLVEQSSDNVLVTINSLSLIGLRDKSGTFIGARMGRPEKAKMRKLKGSPHVLFPVGEEGGRLRSFQSALDTGKITADVPIFYCTKCSNETIFSVCLDCGELTESRLYCQTCGVVKSCPHNPRSYTKKEIPINTYFEKLLAFVGMNQYPDLIKGVRGTSNKTHLPENLAKGILRAKHEIYVNKDGTTRYDMTELPLTHFRPKEIGTSVEKLKSLGYKKDIFGTDLERDDQLLEIFPQDFVLPCSKESLDEPGDEVFFRVANFVDDLLTSFYRLKSFYNLKKKEDLVGHMFIGLAPHISAGILGRLIGFSKTQVCFAHPLWHAAHRRDCDGDENCVILLMDALLNFSRQYLPDRRGARTMDAPLVLTTILNPSEVDDMVHKLDVGWRYPLEFYETALNYKSSRDVKIDLLGKYLGTEREYEKMGFTHDVTSINMGVGCSAYKTIPSMQEKLHGQMKIAEKIRAVDTADVARLVIERHFMKDIRGNLRKFSMQKFRCVSCNESYRRPPLQGTCLSCGGKIIFTISEGSVMKYLEPSMSLARKYDVPAHLIQILELTKRRVEGLFGKESDKQMGLGAWFG